MYVKNFIGFYKLNQSWFLKSFNWWSELIYSLQNNFYRCCVKMDEDREGGKPFKT